MLPRQARRLQHLSVLWPSWRRYATEQVKQAIEKTLVVDTLGMVRCWGCRIHPSRHGKQECM